ncbi:S8 family serine peptidase [Shewanella insulae]|uniref:S8 family serine peptidase n=1 Tax=Shewanella insulae TaxID=2681496 RepID=UPI001EFE7CA2|nr:S8 family serine peptidase [Shewanella insulae]MCG9714319.1 S8 family serine peptidase [Shewanella insulae]
MKLKKISLMTVAAIYAAGVGGAAASSNADTHNMRSIEITDAILKYNEDLRAGKQRNGTQSSESLQQRGSNGKNVHRAIATQQNSKVPFKFEAGITGEQTYIVELSDKPVSLYRGDLPNLAATSPKMSTVPVMLNARGHNKLDMQSSAVKRYSDYLNDKQTQVLSQISAKVGGNVEVKQRYSLAFNGMAMRMTQDQAARVAALPGIRNVSLEKTYELHTDTGPKHIGAEGLWMGTAAEDKYKGEGIVVGVLDTGINTDHPSFAAVAGDGYVHQMPARYSQYLGDCEKAEFAAMCNDKLIGVRSYESITDSYLDPIFQPDKNWWEVDGPKRPQNGEDYNGHGSHTSSTAAGNELSEVDYVVPSLGETGDGIPTGLKFSKLSGVAPRANVIMYQVCYPGDGSYGDSYAGCKGSALLAAIDDAIADGVDVINYSIGSTFGSFPWDDPMELGFLAAREAGISVSASAGNSYMPQYASQARGAIDHLSPWLTSVAATTHGREITVEGKMLTNATGGEQPLVDLNGSGITDAYTGPVVEAKAYGSEYEMCNEPFPAGFFDVDPEGNPYATAPIVVCMRGEIARVTKAVNVQAGGAGGFILWNAGYSDPTHNDPYVIPGINIDYGSYYGNSDNGNYGLQDWLAAGSDHALTITASEVGTKEGTADYVADFSSRGPNLEAPDVMSPNLAAPGVNVYAAWADEMPFTTQGMPADYAAISGTSMAAPHVAGAMALLTQAHPDWTPAQIQSALMTTASLEGVTRSRDGYPFDPVAAGYSDAGSGVINVSRANNAPLLLDESVENYRAANPKNGGNIHTLNLPYFYHDSCAGTCTWMRTVTATQDGTWTVEATPNDMEGAQMLELEVSPKTFTLKAGESQAISLKAKILEVEAIGADSSQIQLTGSVKLTPSDNSKPMQHLPVGVRYKGDTLPSEVSGIIHRQQGHNLTPELHTAEVQSLNSRVYGLTKGERHDAELKRAEVRKYSDGYTRQEIEDGGAKVIFFDVPEGTKRVVWEVLSAPKHAYTSIDLGMDVNGDEEIQWLDEAICYSQTDNGDFCAINNPMPGRYWAIAANWKWEFEDEKNLADPFELSLAVVGDADTGNLTIEGPQTNDGMTPYQLQLNYNLPGAEEGDVYYGMVGLGSDEYNDTNLGDFAVKLVHMGSDTNVTASQTAAKEGDILDFVVELAPNLLGGEREFTFNTELSDGLVLMPDSVSVGGIGNYSEGMTVDGNTIAIAAAQPSSSEMKRHYVFTTNLTDETCRVPYGEDGSFYDLPAQGFSHIGLSGASNQTLQIPLSANGLPHVPLYGNPEVFGQDVLAISPFGYVQFDPMPDFWNFNLPFNDSFQGFPDTMVAPLWRGDVRMPQTMFNWNTGRYEHAVYAVITNKHYIFQWDGGEEWNSFLSGNTNPDPDAKFNIQTIVATDISFDEASPEIIFAYETLETENDQFGSVGLHGYWGERASFGPAGGWLNDGFAYKDVDEKISSGTVVCADYRGPEQSKVSLKFSARVSANAVGTDNYVKVDTQYADSELVTVTHEVSSPSNISVAAIADMSMEENTTLEGISVTYNDVKGTANGIKVSGEHITATVDGDSFSITPDADWYGETLVTVTVHDMAYPSDAASTSFMLTVNSDGVEPTPPTPETPDQGGDSDSGGSLGFLALGLLGLIAGRRKLH